MEITANTRIIDLTVGELIEYLRYLQAEQEEKIQEDADWQEGLECIEREFHVSKTTAYNYKNTILRDACAQVSGKGSKVHVNMTLARQIMQGLTNSGS